MFWYVFCTQPSSLQAEYFEFAKKFSMGREEDDTRVAVLQELHASSW